MRKISGGGGGGGEGPETRLRCQYVQLLFHKSVIIKLLVVCCKSITRNNYYTMVRVRVDNGGSCLATPSGGYPQNGPNACISAIFAPG